MTKREVDETKKEFLKQVRKTTAWCEPRKAVPPKKRWWENLLQRIEALKEFGLETTMWYHLLEPILKRFVRAWDEMTQMYIGGMIPMRIS